MLRRPRRQDRRSCRPSTWATLTTTRVECLVLTVCPSVAPKAHPGPWGRGWGSPEGSGLTRSRPRRPWGETAKQKLPQEPISPGDEEAILLFPLPREVPPPGPTGPGPTGLRAFSLTEQERADPACCCDECGHQETPMQERASPVTWVL